MRSNILLRRLFGQQDRQSIGFLPGGAADRPGSYFFTCLHFVERRNDLLFERLPRFAVTEEIRHTDQNIVEHGLCFAGVLAQIFEIAFERGRAVQLHAALDASQDGGELVMVEILPGAGLDLCQNTLKCFGFLLRELSRVMRQLRAVLNIFNQFLSELCSGKDHVCKTCIDGRQGHAVVFCLIGVLDHDRPPRSLTSFSPTEPSVPPPERMTAIDSRFSLARLRKKVSMGARWPRGSVNSAVSRCVSVMIMFRLGGMIYTWSASTFTLRDTWRVGICVCCCNISAR